MENPVLQALLDAADNERITKEPRREPVRLHNGDNIARIVFKDEGWDDEGRTHGPAYAVNDKGELSINYSWITRRDAERLATALGVDFQDA